ncbi:MAG TPA: carboxypeptidase regulatory-like domain-containing protein [Longimicrobium sp.]
MSCGDVHRRDDGRAATLNVTPMPLRSIRRLTAALLLAWAAPSAAQAPDTASVVGRAVDAATLAPLAGVQVRMSSLKRTAVSDSNGVFRIGGVPLGDHPTMVTRLGYRATVAVWRVGREGLELEVPLAAEPLMLEAIRVQSGRFERRIRSSGSTVRGFGDQELMLSAAPDASEFVRTRMGLAMTTCGSLSSGGAADCVRVRGAPVRPCVIVDERPAFGGLTELGLYRPQDLFRVDVLAGGAVIQVYTTQFVQRMTQRRWTPMSPDNLARIACVGGGR